MTPKQDWPIFASKPPKAPPAPRPLDTRTPRRFPNEIRPVRSQRCPPILTFTPFIIVTNFVYRPQKITNERSDALLCEKLNAA